MNALTVRPTSLLGLLKEAMITGSKAEFLNLANKAGDAAGIPAQKVLADFVAVKAAKTLAEDPQQAIKNLGKRSNETIWGKDLPEVYRATASLVEGLHPTVKAAAQAAGIIGEHAAPAVVPTTAMVKRTRMSR